MPAELPAFGMASALRIVLRLVAVVLLAWGIHWLISWAMTTSEMLQTSARLQVGLLVLMLLIYAALIAVPFVPGIELGIALMMLEGGRVAPLVYLATVLGLVSAFLAGSRIPYASLRRLLADLRLRRACALLERIGPLDQQARLALLRQRLPVRFAAFALRHRYLALAASVNLPGNFLLGGGGGILFIAGLSGLFSTRATALTMAIAVAPVPVVVWIFDTHLLA